MAFVDHVSATAGWQGHALAQRVQEQEVAVVWGNGTFAAAGKRGSVLERC